MKKFISILLTVAMMFTMMAPVFATVPGGITIDDPEAGAFGDFGDKVADVLGAIRWVGYAIALGMLLYIGIKYVMSAANEKADLKKGLINYVIGVAILVGASTIFGAIASFMK